MDALGAERGAESRPGLAGPATFFFQLVQLEMISDMYVFVYSI